MAFNFVGYYNITACDSADRTVYHYTRLVFICGNEIRIFSKLRLLFGMNQDYFFAVLFLAELIHTINDCGIFDHCRCIIYDIRRLIHDFYTIIIQLFADGHCNLVDRCSHRVAITGKLRLVCQADTFTDFLDTIRCSSKCHFALVDRLSLCILLCFTDVTPFWNCHRAARLSLQCIINCDIPGHYRFLFHFRIDHIRHNLWIKYVTIYKCCSFA